MPHATYPPLNTLKPVAPDVWIVDGPEIRYGPAFAKMPFPTRMTVIRLASGNLLLHSPTPLTPELKAEMEALGRVRHLVGPNRIHYWWLKDWKNAFPGAGVFLAPRIREQAESQGAAGRLDFDAGTLDRETGWPWDGEVATLTVEGRFMTEVEFFHRESRTLVLTDLIENFEPAKLSWPMRLLTRLGGAQGSMPRDMRLTFRDRAALRRAVETMIAWNPDRIILAHGRWYEKDGAAELTRAFAWLLR